MRLGQKSNSKEQDGSEPWSLSKEQVREWCKSSRAATRKWKWDSRCNFLNKTRRRP